MKLNTFLKIKFLAISTLVSQGALTSIPYMENIDNIQGGPTQKGGISQDYTSGIMFTPLPVQKLHPNVMLAIPVTEQQKENLSRNDYPFGIMFTPLLVQKLQPNVMLAIPVTEPDMENIVVHPTIQVSNELTNDDLKKFMQNNINKKFETNDLIAIGDKNIKLTHNQSSTLNGLLSGGAITACFSWFLKFKQKSYFNSSIANFFTKNNNSNLRTVAKHISFFKQLLGITEFKPIPVDTYTSSVTLTPMLVQKLQPNVMRAIPVTESDMKNISVHQTIQLTNDDLREFMQNNINKKFKRNDLITIGDKNIKLTHNQSSTLNGLLSGGKITTYFRHFLNYRNKEHSNIQIAKFLAKNNSLKPITLARYISFFKQLVNTAKFKNIRPINQKISPAPHREEPSLKMPVKTDQLTKFPETTSKSFDVPLHYEAINTPLHPHGFRSSKKRDRSDTTDYHTSRR